MQRWKGSRKIAPEENCPPALILTLILNQILTLTGGQFASGAIFRTPAEREFIWKKTLLEEDSVAGVLLKF